MDNEVKWICIAVAVVFGLPMLGVSVEKYTQNECRVAAIQKGMPADEIAKVCK